MCLGVVGRVSAVWDEGGVPMALVRTASAERAACLLYAPEAARGSDVLVHLGFVVEVLQPEVAAEALVLRGASEAKEGRNHGEGDA